MKREDKDRLIEEMSGSFRGAPHVILANFRGLTVNQVNDLRGRIRAAGGHYRVVKNRLARRAAAGTAAERLADRFEGPCGLATHESDPVALAKALNDFAKDHPALELVAAVVDAHDVVDAKGVGRLASLPGLPELRAQLLALVQTPATTLVRLLATPGTQVARVLDARREKVGGEGA